MTGIELSVERWTVVDSSLSSDLGKGLPRSRVRAHALQGKGTGDSKLGKQEPGGSILFCKLQIPSGALNLSGGILSDTDTDPSKFQKKTRNFCGFFPPQV